MSSLMDLIDTDAPKKATNLSINESLLKVARNLGINISKACERGLEAQIAEVEARRWREENSLAIDSSNDYVTRNGLPLARHRRF